MKTEDIYILLEIATADGARDRVIIKNLEGICNDGKILSFLFKCKTKGFLKITNGKWYLLPKGQDAINSHIDKLSSYGVFKDKQD